MSVSDKVEVSCSQVRKIWERRGVQPKFRFLAFCLSLLPIPVIQQSGQALDRYLSDKSLDARLEKIWEEINRLSERAVELGSLEESVLEIARTVEAHPSLQKDAMELLQKLGTPQEEFCAISEDNSFQQILHSVIAAESAKFLARNGGKNSIEHTTINAQRTLLHSTGGSTNYVNQSRFGGLTASVEMKGISTQGDIHVSENSLGFGGNSSIIFGNPDALQGKCPQCGTMLEVDRRALTGITQIQCYKCKSTHQLKISKT